MGEVDPGEAAAGAQGMSGMPALYGLYGLSGICGLSGLSRLSNLCFWQVSLLSPAHRAVNPPGVLAGNTLTFLRHLWGLIWL